MPKRMSTVYSLQSTVKKIFANSSLAVVRSRWTVDPKKGFTLVELMVVISIIAILSAIGLTVFSQTQQAARDGRRTSDMQETQKALEQYYAVNQNYPDPLAAGVILNSVNELDTYYQNSTAPDDPNPALVGGIHYRYWHCSGLETYNICARLENCTGKCNFPASGPDGCTQVGQPGSVVTPGALYCLRAISN